MRLRILSMGREKADPTAPLVADYVTRIGRFLPISDTVLKPGPEDRFMAHLKRGRGGVVVVLDEAGQQMSSLAFAHLVDTWMNRGNAVVTLVIGGADGVSTTVKREASLLLSLSAMTLPHRFARLILVEQLYRALCINRHVPYHK